MANPNWYLGQSGTLKRPETPLQNEATKRAIEELEMISTLRDFAKVCQQQAERRKKGFRW